MSLSVRNSRLFTVAASLSSTQLIPENGGRLGLLIFNDSPSDLYLTFGVAATTSAFSVRIPSMGFFSMDTLVSTQAIYGLWTNANGSARITEFV